MAGTIKSTPTGRIAFENQIPVTQSSEAVKALITFHNHGHEPAEMPAFYRLTGVMVLVQSNKKDMYYVVTLKDCSCPARTYNPGKPCKHMRKFFSVLPKVEKTDSIRPTGKWAGGHNGPVSDLLEGYETSFEADW